MFELEFRDELIEVVFLDFEVIFWNVGSIVSGIADESIEEVVLILVVTYGTVSSVTAD